jgi:hypothetical protein
MATKNPDGFIPDEEDLLSGTSKKNARFAVSATITGRGTHSKNFAHEVDARNYMKQLRDEMGTRLIRCRLIPIG